MKIETLQQKLIDLQRQIVAPMNKRDRLSDQLRKKQSEAAGKTQPLNNQSP